jgi:hypothetical protein
MQYPTQTECKCHAVSLFWTQVKMETMLALPTLLRLIFGDVKTLE